MALEHPGKPPGKSPGNLLEISWNFFA